MHDKMFENQRALERPDLEKYAEQVGLDMGKFKAALDSGKFKQKISDEQAAGGQVGVNGTPTFFINGQVHVGGPSFDQWKGLIDGEIKKADLLLASGVKLEKLYDKITEAPPAPAAAANPPPAAGGPAAEVAVGSAPVKGPKGAPVTIVEWSDFQCPYCSQGVSVIKQLEDSYKDKFRVAYKHQPLPMHPNAQIAAEAAAAAQEQGKFWPMHDKMFANQGALDRASLERYAQEVGLDVGKFKAALDSGKFKSAVAADSAEGFKVGANATPTFFVNGRMVQGADYARIKAIMDEELAKKKK
jgi:protein-disulfide isomerase